MKKRNKKSRTKVSSVNSHADIHNIISNDYYNIKSQMKNDSSQMNNDSLSKNDKINDKNIKGR